MTPTAFLIALVKLAAGLLLHSSRSLSFSSQVSEGPEPSFFETIPNNTIVAGRDVTLPCVVENLGKYKVAWIHTDRHTLLTLDDRIISRNPRYKIVHNNHRTWMLTIQNVRESDSGHYMCQINTSPMKSLVGILEVVVPPAIDEQHTSSDTDVREGVDVVLRCRATGSPTPEIKWRREDDRNISLGLRKVPSVKGEFLNITKTSRLHMAAYLCIASNGVQPSVSKRIMLNVKFAPMIWIPNQLVGAAIGANVVLDCNLESYPQSVTYWKREGGMMILSNIKYNILLEETGTYKIQMKLHIRDLDPNDFGSYNCVAKNSLGETEGTIRLYEIPKPHSSTLPTRGIPASSRAEGAHLVNAGKIAHRPWHKNNNEGLSVDLTHELEKKDSVTPVTMVYIPDKGLGKNTNGIHAKNICPCTLVFLFLLITLTYRI